ncbi:MFS transporter [Kitasatospora sp. NPDC059571]|uniref:MFS transporter n=1 Tax=Kitasatospora sp. NPDC059571 TaxID=3346871 RepID=UPI0036A66C95
MTLFLQAAVPADDRRRGPLAGARRVTATVFAAQGAAVAAVFTTVPGIQEQLGLSSPVTTVLMVTVALAAGAGSFAGMAAIRRVGAVAAMRCAAVATAAALLLIGWAPGQAGVTVAYLLFGMALGGIDVSVNTRAAAVERAYGRSIFSSFYALWSVGGVASALLTAGMARLGRPPEQILTAQAALVLTLALTIRSHPIADAAASGTPSETAAVPLGRRMWAKLVPFGLVLLVAYVIDSTVSAWSTVYLHQVLAASLPTAPLAYAAYQAGTITGRACADHLIRRTGPAAVIRAAALGAATALAALAGAPGWPYAIAAAGFVGLGVSAFTPLCLATAGRLQPDAAEAILARLNLFNYLGVISGAAASGFIGSSGHFRLAFAIPAVLALLPLVIARTFAHDARLQPVVHHS